MSSDKILGIDLGTTNSAFAIMEANEPEIIPNEKGNRTTPSVVSYNAETDEMRVGEEAKNRAIKAPDNTIQSIKRRMGEDTEIELGGDTYRPEQISALILQKIKHDAEEYLGEEITRAVITVPAYFDNQQREATKAAGKIAGFDVERIINEPTAAAMAYGFDDQGETKNLLVYDLGGGTFDVSMLEIGGGVDEVLATTGNNDLGGDDWDMRLVDHLAERFEEKHGVDPRNDRAALQRLKDKAEETKIALSAVEEEMVDLPFLVQKNGAPIHLEQKISREQLEAQTEDLAELTIGPTRQVIQEAPFPATEIDEVILVGGSTRMPMIQRQVEEITGITPEKSIDPDEAVALGAAIQGGVLAGEVDDLVLMDVTPLSLGVEVKGGLFQKLIERNTSIPTMESSPFTTAEDDQTQVEIRVFQGEREIAEENELLGEFTLSGIPPAPAGTPNIDVEFIIDEDGIVTVEAEDEQSGASDQITLEGSTSLSEEKIEEMREDAEKHAEQDKKRRARIQARNDAREAVRRAEKLLDKYDDVPPGLQNQITGRISDIKEALENEASIVEDFVNLEQELTDLLKELSQRDETTIDPNTVLDDMTDRDALSEDGASSEGDTDNSDTADESPPAEAVDPSEADAFDSHSSSASEEPSTSDYGSAPDAPVDTSDSTADGGLDELIGDAENEDSSEPQPDESEESASESDPSDAMFPGK